MSSKKNKPLRGTKRLAEQNHVASSDLTKNTISKKTLIGSIQILCQSAVMNC